MFDMRTYQDRKGDLLVQINNRSGRSLTVTLQTERGEEVVYVPVSKRQGLFTIKLDVSETPSGLYRVAVGADIEKAVQLVRLATPTQSVESGRFVVMLLAAH